MVGFVSVGWSVVLVVLTGFDRFRLVAWLVGWLIRLGWLVGVVGFWLVDFLFR